MKPYSASGCGDPGVLAAQGHGISLAVPFQDDMYDHFVYEPVEGVFTQETQFRARPV